MNEVQLFKFESQNVRVVIKDGEPWFVGKDVAEVLGYSNTRKALLDHVDNEDKDGVTIRDSMGRNQKAVAINESGLYSLILSSKLESAKKFKRWITNEVLPTIRKTGGYVANDETFIETYLPFADQNTKMLFKATLQTIKKQNELIEKQKPLVNFAETCMASDKSLLVREVAKLASKNGISIGEKRLYQKLREWGLIFKNKNEPYQEYVDRGYFEIAQGVKETEKGSFTWQTMRVTPKGQMYIFNRLKKESDHHATTQS